MTDSAARATIAEEVETLRAIFGPANVLQDGSDLLRVSVVLIHRGAEVAAAADGFTGITLDVDASYPSPHAAVRVAFENVPRSLRPRVKSAVDAVLARRSDDGSGCLYDVVASVQEIVSEHVAAEDAATAAQAAAIAVGRDSSAAAFLHPAAARGIEVVHGEPVVVSRSTFQAHVARIASVADANAVLEELYEDRRIAGATHNIRAYRIVAPRGDGAVTVTADNDDDGEDAAGGRLAHLLELMHAENVIVVITRWFGGVLLGPSRFKVINDTARAMIEAQPWYTGRAAVSTAGGKARR